MTMTNHGQTAVQSAGTGGTGQRARDVASQSAHEARELAGDAWSQVRGVMDRAQSEARGQAGQQAQRAASGMRQWADELRALSDGRPQEAGRMGELASIATDRLTSWAQRLDHEGPDGLLDDVSRFARRRPGLFLAACAGAGFLAGRIMRSAQESGNRPQPRDTEPFVTSPATTSPGSV